MIDEELRKRLAGYGLTTAQIFYYKPGTEQRIINPHWYLWQKYDLQPELPELNKFVDFWRNNIIAEIHSITVAHAMVAAAELRPANGVFRLH